MYRNFTAAAALLGSALLTEGCGSFVARRIAQAPNTYPRWFGPDARVQIAIVRQLLTNFPARVVEVGPPVARLRYRVIEPADFRLGVTGTNWIAGGHPHFRFGFDITLPGKSNAWTTSPRGTVILLHGYGDSQFAMSPWALRLAEAGWRCVLVDLRGHGESTGGRIFYGVQETRDLSQLLDVLAREGKVDPPFAVVGHSYGAALALRWKAVEPRLGNLVVITPYAVLSNTVLNIRDEYASWIPRCLVKAGLRRLPPVLSVPPAELDPATVLARSQIAALFVAGGSDRVVPVAEVRRLYAEAKPGSEFIVVTGATHEAVPFFFADLVKPVLKWLEFGAKNADVCRKKSADGEVFAEPHGRSTVRNGSASFLQIAPTNAGDYGSSR